MCLVGVEKVTYTHRFAKFVYLLYSRLIILCVHRPASLKPHSSPKRNNRALCLWRACLFLQPTTLEDDNCYHNPRPDSSQPFYCRGYMSRQICSAEIIYPQDPRLSLDVRYKYVLTFVLYQR